LGVPLGGGKMEWGGTGEGEVSLQATETRMDEDRTTQSK
jgi:hypothetical protein